ncbi:MAG: hypothetical protein IJ423_02375 [Clostridia bacterium]|nr:hypothetical protein [Clostridia bacterium]
MKKLLKQILVFMLLVCNLFVCTLPVSAGKAEIKRNIAIVFDNSGTMYYKGEKAWCRATYAMEVFASMMNKGDSLSIHPMNPIEVNGNKYTMDSPFVISDPSQSSQIRNIYTKNADDTPIEAIDAAIKGLSSSQATENYLIVLTDGTVFYEGGKELSASVSKKKLEERFNKSVGPDLNILYLRIGSGKDMPNINSEYYFAQNASDSKNVLSVLTMMCNKIFARDILPASHISDKTIDFDITLSKLIVFVQGENVSDVKVAGKNGATATPSGSAKTQYSDVGSGNYKNSVDNTLQGMLVTYTDCSAGSYDISYSGKASNVEVYYEPDADLAFVFTDEQGNLVEPESLYKGNYKVQFGLKDAKTGELITSDLLGDPLYEGKYVVNDKEYPIKHSGKSGETPVALDVGDTFTAELTASYLNGYSITKTAKDFGWPEGSLTVAAKPAGDVRLEITGGDMVYNLANLEQGGTYTAKVYYKGEQLTGTELEKVELKWEPEKSNAEIKKEFKDDHWALSLHYKNPSDPIATECGKCTVTIHAFYTPDGSEETSGRAPLTYLIEDKVVTPEIILSVPKKHFEISKLDKGKSIKALITSKGNKLSPEQFQALDFKVDCQGIGYTVTPLPEESAFEIKLNSSGTLEKGKYKITTTVVQKDNLGRELSDKESVKVRLSNMPLWLIWLIWLLIIAVIIVIAYFVSHIKRLPTKLHTNKRDCVMNIGGEDVTKNTAFNASINDDTLTVEAKYAGMKTGVRMNVQPGTDSFLMTKQAKRKAMVSAQSVKKFGAASIEDVSVGNRKYLINEETYKLEPAISGAKDFDLSNGNTVMYSGTMQLNGVNEDFYVKVKLNYKK